MWLPVLLFGLSFSSVVVELPPNRAKIPRCFGFGSLRPTSSNLSRFSSACSRIGSSGCDEGALIWIVFDDVGADCRTSVDDPVNRGNEYDGFVFRDGVPEAESVVMDACVENDGKRI